MSGLIRMQRGIRTRLHMIAQGRQAESAVYAHTARCAIYALCERAKRMSVFEDFVRIM